jgi:UDPglucose 6-dehydrogenase
MDQARRVLRDLEFASDPYACADSADVLVLVTEWAEYRRLDLGRLRRAMRAPIVVDLRNALAPEAAARHGFALLCVGGAAQLPAPVLRGVPAVTNPALTLQCASARPGGRFPTPTS